MSSDYMCDLTTMFVYLSMLCVGFVIANYILPRIPCVKRWLESPFRWEDEDEESTHET